MNNKTAIELKNVNKSFGTDGVVTQVLFDVNQAFQTGQLSMIVGPSGCGKTTLISIMGAILDADSGEINVFNNKIHEMKTEQKTRVRKENISFIYQHFNLIPTLNLKENVSIPLLINNVDRVLAEKKAEGLLEIVGLGKRTKSFPSQLSGGEQQRVSIARALVSDPKLIICDEPTASLDGKTGAMIVQMLKKIALQPDKCVIIVTHDARIFEYADRMISLEDGKIVSDEIINRRD